MKHFNLPESQFRTDMLNAGDKMSEAGDLAECIIMALRHHPTTEDKVVSLVAECIIERIVEAKKMLIAAETALRTNHGA